MRSLAVAADDEMVSGESRSCVKAYPVALGEIRDHLDRMMYGLIDFRMSLELEPTGTGFPDFGRLRGLVARLGAEHQVIFRLLRLGETVDERSLRAAIPGRVIEAMVDTGLLHGRAGGWCTPNLLLVPAEGMFVIVSIPPFYPTAAAADHTSLNLSSSLIAKTIPQSLNGKRVLDICSGSGIQALICAARGAKQVVGLELSAEAVANARANALLNGLADRIEFRVSDGLDALVSGESFDFVICNTPFAPVTAGQDVPERLDDIGNSTMWRILDALPPYLAASAHGVVASWRIPGDGSSTVQLGRAAASLRRGGCASRAYLTQVPDRAGDIMETLCEDLGSRAGLPAELAELIQRRTLLLLQDMPASVNGFYNQILLFARDRAQMPAEVTPVFGLPPLPCLLPGA